MKNYKLIMVLVSVFLTACNTVSKKPTDGGQLSVGEYKLKLELADEYYTKKSYPEALEVYRDINQKFSDDTHVLFRMGNIYAQQGDASKAIESYEAALKVDSGLTKTWFNLGVIYMQQSAKTWQQMSQYADRTDPLYKAADYYNRGMMQLIQPRNN
jgi:tetratricopeptide (TPR) repeat protein